MLTGAGRMSPPNQHGGHVRRHCLAGDHRDCRTDELPDRLAAGQQSRVSAPSRWLVLGVLCAGMLMVVLDTTAVNVALPAIRSDLGFSQPGLAWVVNAYLISFGGMLLLAGRVSDLLSRRSVFLAGLTVFTAASFACGLAQDQPALIGARFVQGIGGAMLTAVSLGMVAALFPEPAARARAIGVYSFVSTGGGSVGLVAGGALTQSAGWHWVFIVNVPIGAGLAAAGWRWLARDAGTGMGSGADYSGAALITAALMLGVYAIAGPAAQVGWAAPRTLAFAGAAVAVLATFLGREAMAREPLIPLSAFRSGGLLAGNIVQGLLTAGMFGFFFLSALYLRLVLGYNALAIGLAFLPMTMVVAAVSLRYASGLIARHGAGLTLLPGLGLVTAGLFMFARVPVHGRYLPDVLPVMLVLGSGVGLAFPAVMALAMSSATERDAGLASGLINTTVQVAGALGLAVLAALATRRTSSLRQARDPRLVALTGGYHLAATIGAGLALAGIAVAGGFVLAARKDPAVAARQSSSSPAAGTGRAATAARGPTVPASAVTQSPPDPHGAPASSPDNRAEHSTRQVNCGRPPTGPAAGKQGGIIR